MKTKDYIITLFFIIITLLIFYFFPTDNKFQQIITIGIFFICLPVIYYKIILKKPLSSLGLQIGDWKQGLIFSGFSLIIVGIFFGLFIKYSNFLNYYFIPSGASENFSDFMIYEFFAVLMLVVVYEFFFRGFIMFSVNYKAGKYVGIFLQTAIFFIFIWAAEAPLWLFLPYLLFSPFAGLIAEKSKSILYSGATQFLIIFVLDIFIIKMIQ